jgi:hypothetical protein
MSTATQISRMLQVGSIGTPPEGRFGTNNGARRDRLRACWRTPSATSRSKPPSTDDNSESARQYAHGQPRPAPEPGPCERSSAPCCTSSAYTTNRHRTYCAKLQSPNCTADPSSATLSASTSQSPKRATGRRAYCANLQSPNCTADPSSATLSASTSQSLKRATGRRAYCANLQPPNCTADAGSATFSASTACAVARCASRRTTTNSPTGSAASAGAASSATSRI